MSRNDEFLVSQNRANQDLPLPLSAILRSGIQDLMCSYSASEESLESSQEALVAEGQATGVTLLVVEACSCSHGLQT